MAFLSVTWSTYFKSPPIGTPEAMRVLFQAAGLAARSVGDPGSTAQVFAATPTAEKTAGVAPAPPVAIGDRLE